MMSLVAVGVLILSALSIVCFAAYKIRAKSFEVSTSVGKIASFSIKIISADAENPESACNRVGLLGRDARPSVGDEVSLPNGPLVPPLVHNLKAAAERGHANRA
jgi:hypothetical protein